MTTWNMDDLLKKAKENDFYQPDPGEYSVEIVRFLDKDPGIVSAFFKVLDGPEGTVGREFLQTFGMWRKSDQEGQWAHLNLQTWAAAGVTEDYLRANVTQDSAATIQAIKAALLGAKLRVEVRQQKKKPEYIELPIFKIKVLEERAMPTAVGGAPAAAPATGLPTPAAPLAAAPALPTPQGNPNIQAVEDPQVTALKAELAAAQAQAAAQTANGAGALPVPAAPAVTEEDPGF